MQRRLASLAWAAGARMPGFVKKLGKSTPGARLLRDRLLGTPAGSSATVGEPKQVVYLPTWLEWDSMKQRPQFLLEAFRRAGHQVWFVDPRSEPSNVVEGVRIVPDLRSVPAENVILYLHFAPLRHLIRLFQHPVIVYDVLDDLSIYDSGERGIAASQRVRAHHRALMERADVVIASNPGLLERHRAERSDIVLVENGVDPELFRPDGPGPDDLASDGRPIVGYHGAVAPWIDFQLLEGVVSLRPDLRFVFVGPIDPLAQDAAARLERAPNVEFLGVRESAQIDRYVRSFDVGIVPFVLDEMTFGVTPLKMFEYLASGVGVVATPLPACRDHAEVVVASGAETFAKAIDAALGAGPDLRSRWIDAGRQAAWDRRLAPLLERLNELGSRVVE